MIASLHVRGRISPSNAFPLVVVGTALAAGAAVSRDPRALALPVVLFVLIGGMERIAQGVLLVSLVEGITHPFGHLGRFDPEFMLVWAMVAALAVSGGVLRQWPRPIRSAGAAYVGAILASGLTLGASLGLSPSLRLLNYVGVALLAAQLTSRGRKLILVPLVIATLFHVILGTIELARNSTFFYVRWKTLDATKVDGITRIASTIGDPNYLALTLMILGGATLALVPAGRTRRRFQIVAIAAFALIPATFSRGGMIALAASAVVMLLRVLSRQALARAAVVSAVVACALFATAEIAPEEFHVFTARFSLTQRSDASVVSRRELQARGYSLATAHLALGVGPGVFEIKERAFLDPAQPLNQQTDVLDTYLQAALSGGLLAFIGFAGLLILPAIQLTRRRCPLGYILGGVAAGVATLDTLTLAPLWVGIGIAAALLSASCDQPAGHPA